MSLRTHFLVMGPTSCGKSTKSVGVVSVSRHWENANVELVAFDADDVHTPEDKVQMSYGVPLSEEQRAIWLEKVVDRVLELEAEGKTVMLACSALKREHRDYLREKLSLKIIFLDVSEQELKERSAWRKENEGHFVDPRLIESQLDTLERPTEDEDPAFVPTGLSKGQSMRHVVGVVKGELGIPSL